MAEALTGAVWDREATDHFNYLVYLGPTKMMCFESTGISSVTAAGR
jgi:hypothetical protein